MRKFWFKIALGVSAAALALSISIAALAIAATVYHGTATIVTTGTEVQVTSTIGAIWCLNIIADRDNQQPIYVGVTGVDGDGYKLWPGAALHMHGFTFTEIYIEGYAGDKVYWIVGATAPT